MNSKLFGYMTKFLKNWEQNWTDLWFHMSSLNAFIYMFKHGCRQCFEWLYFVKRVSCDCNAPCVFLIQPILCFNLFRVDLTRRSTISSGYIPVLTILFPRALFNELTCSLALSKLMTCSVINTLLTSPTSLLMMVADLTGRNLQLRLLKSVSCKKHQFFHTVENIIGQEFARRTIGIF